MASVEFACPQCQQRLRIAAEGVSKRVRCQRCKNIFRPVEVIERETALPALTVEDEPSGEKGRTVLVGGGQVGRPPVTRSSEAQSGRKETRVFGSVGDAEARPSRESPEIQVAAKEESIEIPPPRISDKGNTVVMQQPPPVPRRIPKGISPDSSLLKTRDVSILDEPLFPLKREQKRYDPADSVPPSSTTSEPPPAREKAGSRDPIMPPEPPPGSNRPGVVSVPTPSQESLEEAAVALARASIEVRPTRSPSRLSIYRLSKHRTTMFEVANVAERLSMVTERKIPGGVGWKVAVSSALGLVLVLLVALVLATGSARLVLAPVLFAVVCALLLFFGLRLLPRLARRVGGAELPGKAFTWVGIAITLIGGAAAAITWGMSEATARIAVVVLPYVRPDIPKEKKEAEEGERADSTLQHPPGHIRVGSGVLFIPPKFTSVDGEFDLVLHYHGNTQLVQASVADVGINALVHTTNLGLGSSPYEDYFSVPGAFDNVITKIEERVRALGLRDARVKRIALMSWSAGYGALYYILDQNRFDPERIDAVLMMDSLHAGYLGAHQVDPLKIAPFVAYAKEAAAGKKLFVITHSDIRPNGYASTTETTDAILAALGIERQKVDPADASPPNPTLDVALRAMPASANAWLEVNTMAHQGNFHAYGCSGQMKEHHMAHLIQMSVTVLPELKKRWQ